MNDLEVNLRFIIAFDLAVEIFNSSLSFRGFFKEIEIWTFTQYIIPLQYHIFQSIAYVLNTLEMFKQTNHMS